MKKTITNIRKTVKRHSLKGRHLRISQAVAAELQKIIKSENIDPELIINMAIRFAQHSKRVTISLDDIDLIKTELALLKISS
ncbi:MAG: hypothetical protein ACTSQI_07690 [Candidatus Helarchaeota archaeon]